MTAILNHWAEAFDLPILDWIQTHIQSDFMDFIMPYITLLGDAGIFWIAVAVFLLFFKKYRKVGLGMGFAMILGLLLCNATLKPLVARIRPYDYQLEYLGREITLLIEKQHDFSFPSGHTIASFEACTVLMLGDKRLGIPATLLAILIAFSRLYLYVHYPSDVIASVILGTLLGFVGYYLAQNLSVSLKGRYLK